MTLKISVFARSQTIETNWKKELDRAIGPQADVLVECGGAAGQLVLIDAAMSGLDEFLARLDRKGRALVLVIEEGEEGGDGVAEIPEAWADQRVDDILVVPFRPLEVLSKLRQIQQVFMWDEVSQLNASFSNILGHLKEDMQVAERLQKARLPARFPDIKGLAVHHRYLAGMKSGGDHFDVADSRDGKSLSLILSDSSSYGLSSSVLGVLMKVAMKLSSDETRSAAETVRRIQDELLLTLNDKDRLSLFYGVVSRADWKLRYLNLGHSCAYYSSAGRSYVELPAQGAAIARGAGGAIVQGANALAAAFPSYTEQEFQLEPEGRLVLLSDGFVEAAGGSRGMLDLLECFRKGDPKDCLNELVFKVKSAFTEADDLPLQDCTAVVFDVESNILRLARR